MATLAGLRVPASPSRSQSISYSFSPSRRFLFVCATLDGELRPGSQHCLLTSAPVLIARLFPVLSPRPLWVTQRFQPPWASLILPGGYYSGWISWSQTCYLSGCLSDVPYTPLQTLLFALGHSLVHQSPQNCRCWVLDKVLEL